MKLLAALSANLLLAAPLLGAQADDAAKQFDQLFGEEIRRVQGTADSADDIELSRRLTKVAGTVADQPAVMEVMLERSYDLAARFPSGTATAVEAMELLAEKLPERRDGANAKVLALLQREFQRAMKAEELAKAGQPLLDKLLELADEAAANSDYAAAVLHLNKALPVAARIKSPAEPAIRSRILALSHRQRVEKEIAALQERILRDRTDKGAANDLVVLLITEQNKPSLAAQYLDMLADEELKKHIGLATKESADLVPADHLSLGLWYEGLAKRSALIVRRSLYQRAQEHLQAFLDKQSEQNIKRLQGEIALKRVQGSIKELAADPSAPKDIEGMYTFTGKPLRIEAERAQVIVKPMQVVRGRGAGGGQFVFEPDDRDPKKNDERGQLIVHVKATEAGDAYLWVRVRSDLKNQILYIGVEPGKKTTIPVSGSKKGGVGEPVRQFLPGNIPDWTWVQFDAKNSPRERDALGQLTAAGKAAEKGMIHLVAGLNSVEILGARRDDGAQIDAIYLSRTPGKPE